MKLGWQAVAAPIVALALAAVPGPANANENHWVRIGAATGGPLAPSGNQDLYAVSALQAGGFVAAGFDSAGAGGGGDAAVWTSPDGIAWTRRQDMTVGPFAWGLSQRIDDLVQTPQGTLIAVGRDGAGNDGLDAAVWRSTDSGATWTRIGRTTTFALSDHQTLLGVAVNPNGLLVAVGSTALPGFPQAGDPVAFWSSDDGVTWTRDTDADLNSGGTATFHDVEAHPSGYFIAVGDGPNFATAGAWLYVPGAGWSGRLDMNAGGFSSVAAIAFLPVSATNPQGLFVAGGLDKDFVMDAAVWTSVAGFQWARRGGDPGQAFNVPGSEEITALSVAPSGHVVAGGASSSEAAAVWTSPDGLSWTAVPGAIAAQGDTSGVLALDVSSAGRHVGVGFAQAGSGRDAAVWLGFEAPQLTSVSPTSGSAGSTVQIAGSAFTTATAVQFGSTPAESFTIVSDTEMTAVAPHGSGTVAVSVTTPNGVAAGGANGFFTFTGDSAGGQPPPGDVPPVAFVCEPQTETPFTDTSGSFAEADIACLAAHGVVAGTTATTYTPGQVVTRDQMAVFLMRAWETAAGHDYAGPTSNPFGDVAGNFAEERIAELVGQGITAGCAAALYCPSNAVTRSQMAIFLVRLFERLTGVDPAPTPGGFTDVAGTFAEAEINQLLGLGVTSGTSATTFSPDAAVTREQMAVFVVNLLVAASQA